jgi:integrase
MCVQCALRVRRRAVDGVGRRLSPRRRLRDLRHSFGSLLAAGGVDLVNIQAAMGHSQIQTTVIYVHAKDAKEQAHMFTRALSDTGRGQKEAG